MFTLRRVLCAAILVALTSGTMAFAQEKNPMRVLRGTLMRGNSAYTIRAIMTPEAGKPGTAKDDIARAMNRIAETGAQTYCVDVYGISEDGKSIAPEAVEAIRQVKALGDYRSMYGIVRLFGEGAPKTDKARAEWARTAAKTFKDDEGLLYLIDGDSASKHTRYFNRGARSLAVISPKYGDVRLVTEPTKSRRTVIALYGAVPEPIGEAHFILSPGDDSLQKLETAMMDSVESQPWTPDNSVLAPEELADGFVALFDGKSLNGWTILGANKNAWGVKDGILMRQEAGSAGLRTNKRYANYILRWEWNLPEGGNNGVHLRAPRAGRNSRIGFEYQMLGDFGAAPDKNSTGSIYDVQAPTTNAVKPNGEWNISEAIIDGPKITYFLNGVKVNEANMDENEDLRPRLRNGFIVLTEHSHAVLYRNVRIKVLP